MSHWQPIGDRPLTKRQLAKLATGRLDPVIGALLGHLEAAIGTDVVRPQVRRIGLFGGLGQGKSSVLEEACQRASQAWHQRRPSRDSAWHWPIARFDVSDFKAEDLEWRFLTAVLLERVLRSLLWPAVLLLGLSLALATLACGPFAAACQAFDWRQMLAISVPGLLLAGLGFLAALYVTPLDRLCGWAARTTGTLPRVVIVDDLDRARVEQQRAFLRSLSRMSYRMGFSVVVCMDECGLLQAAADPEAPEELLRKTLDIELHLPDRSREDVVSLVVNIARLARAANRRQWALLSHPQWLGDLVRVLLLSVPVGQVAPRLIKRIVNQVGQWACQLDTSSVDDWCALLRLEALYRLAPELRRHTDALRQVLEGHSTAGLSSLLKQVGVRASLRERAQRLFDGTAMMQPAMHDGWYRLLSGVPPSALADVALPVTGPSLAPRRSLHLSPGAHRYARLFIEAADLQWQGHEASMVPKGQGGARWQFLTPAFDEKFDLPAGFAGPHAQTHELPKSWHDGGFFKSQTMWSHEWLCWMAVLAACSGPQRQYALAAMGRWLRPLTSGSAGGFDALLLREQLADPGWIRQLDDKVAEQTLQRAHEQQRLRGTAIDGQQIHALLAALGNAKLHLDHRVAALALRRAQSQVKQPVLMATSRHELLARLWPPLLADAADATTLAERLVGSATGVQLRHLGWDGDVPETWLHVWHELAADALTTAQCLRLLFESGCNGHRHDDGELNWNALRLARWLARTDALPGALALIAAPPDQWSGVDQPLPDAWVLTAVVTAVVLDWCPPPALLTRLHPRADADFRDTLAMLFGLSRSNAAPAKVGLAWLNSDVDGFLECSLRRIDPLLDEDAKQRWAVALLTVHPNIAPEAMRELIFRLRWPPL